jgi:hypothetical protein
VYFSDDEIDLACHLKSLGLPWEPQPGHFVWDETGLIEQTSPFHDRVFFILDLKHFLRRTFTIENLQKKFYWLPTWQDAREILQNLGITSGEIAERLLQEQAVEKDMERLVLYRMIHEGLTNHPKPVEGWA